MTAMRELYKALSMPGKPAWQGGSWRLPRNVCDNHVVQPFLALCGQQAVPAKFCMKDLIETP